MKTHLDWSSYDTYGIGDAFSGVPIRGGNYAKAVAVCMHNRACQKEGRGERWSMVIATKKPLEP